MVESSSSWTQQRGTKATKGERRYFITAAEPPFQWSFSLELLSSPNLCLPVVPRQTVTTQGVGFNALQTSSIHTHTCTRKSGGLLHRDGNMDPVISTSSGHSDGGNQERTGCEGHCGMAEAQ